MSTNNPNVVFQPHPGPQLEALTRSEKEILFGGARGGGKSTAMTAWMVEPHFIENPLYRGLVIRRNYTDLRDWIDNARDMWRYLGVKVVGNPAEFRFPSGAKIRTGHLSDENSWSAFLGHEYHKMGIEELTLIDTEEKYLRLISSARSTIKDLKVQIFCTTNPGGPGHHWVKKRFVDSGFNKTYIDPQGNSRIFIPSKVYDNPTLMETDPGYIQMLKSLPDELRSAWLEGSWDTFAGQYFKDFNRDVHVVEPFEIPKSWRKYIAIDYGYTAPFAVVWGAIDNDGNVFIYREHYEAGKELNYHISKIQELTGDEEIHLTIGDPAMWIRNPQNSNRPDEKMPSMMSISDIMMMKGLIMVKANNERVNGWNNMRGYLHWEGSVVDKTLTKAPKLFIFENCENWIRTIPALSHDKHRVEDIDTRQDDHLADATRYMLFHLGIPDKPVRAKPWVIRELEKLSGGEREGDLTVRG
jgi:phage terminase large subunit